MGRKYIPRVVLTCEHCGVTFERKRSEMRGQKQVYCSIPCKETDMVGYRGANYRAAKMRNAGGYIVITRPDGGTMLEHRWVMEQAIGRALRDDEQVHHVNGQVDDNRIDNLLVVSAGEHRTLYHTLDSWSRMHACCVECGTTDVPHAAHGRCDNCHARNYNRTLKEQGIKKPRVWPAGCPPCVECGRTDRWHAAHGLCHTCYQRIRGRQKKAA